MMLKNIDYSKVKIKDYEDFTVTSIQLMSHDMVRISMVLGLSTLSAYFHIDDTNIKAVIIEGTIDE